MHSKVVPTIAKLFEQRQVAGIQGFRRPLTGASILPESTEIMTKCVSAP